MFFSFLMRPLKLEILGYLAKGVVVACLGLFVIWKADYLLITFEFCCVLQSLIGNPILKKINRIVSEALFLHAQALNISYLFLPPFNFVTRAIYYKVVKGLFFKREFPRLVGITHLIGQS